METYSKGKERRRHPRLKLPIQLRPTSSLGPGSRVENISPGGIRISSQRRLPPGETCEIELALSEGGWILVQVRAVWVVELPSETAFKYDMGCELMDLSSEAEKSLENLLSG
jgi:hypothetical protein